MRKVTLKWRIAAHAELYLMLVPLAVYLFIFWLLPLYGIQIGFRDYNLAKGLWGSEFVGLSHFKRFFNSFYFSRVIVNTLGINLFSLAFDFPLTIILALMFNEIRPRGFQQFSQILSYAPAFLSVVVVCGMVVTFLAPSTGMVNAPLKSFGIKPVDFLRYPKYFWYIYILSGTWQGIGFATIIYTAAMSAIPEDLYEAARLDGAGRLRQMWHVTLPGIQHVIIILLILNLGSMMSLGFEKVLLLQNNLNIERSEVISTYVYKSGLIDGKYSYSTAISLFNTVINLTILSCANGISKKVRGIGLW
jgi:putative aldouronate transport system permease protein